MFNQNHRLKTLNVQSLINVFVKLGELLEGYIITF